MLWNYGINSQGRFSQICRPHRLIQIYAPSLKGNILPDRNKTNSHIQNLISLARLLWIVKEYKCAINQNKYGQQTERILTPCLEMPS